MAEEIDCPNFKDRIGSEDPQRAHVLARVWSALYEIQANEV